MFATVNAVSPNLPQGSTSAIQHLEKLLAPAAFFHQAGCRVLAQRLPAGRLGGDFHEATLTDDGRLAVMVGAVHGHGPEAELAKLGLMASARDVLSVDRASGEVMDRLIRPLAELLTHESALDVEVSLFLAVLDRATERLYCRHGGYSWAAIGTKDDTLLVLPATGKAVGPKNWSGPPERGFPLGRVHRLVICSPGALRCGFERGKSLGADRLTDWVRETLPLSPEAQLAALKTRLREHAGSGPFPREDITLLAVDLSDRQSRRIETSLNEEARWCGSDQDELDPSVFLG